MNRICVGNGSLLPGLLVAVVLVGCAGREHALDGSVFIATRGGDAVKLALVPASAVSVERARVRIHEAQEAAIVTRQRVAASGDSLRAALPEARRAFEAAHEAWVAATSSGRNSAGAEAQLELAGRTVGEIEERVRAAEFASGAHFAEDVSFAALAEGCPSTKTDADGRFTLSIPHGDKRVILAWGQRSIGDDVETYQWFVPLTTDNLRTNRLDLTNDNL